MLLAGPIRCRQRQEHSCQALAALDFCKEQYLLFGSVIYVKEGKLKGQSKGKIAHRKIAHAPESQMSLQKTLLSASLDWTFSKGVVSLISFGTREETKLWELEAGLSPLLAVMQAFSTLHNICWDKYPTDTCPAHAVTVSQNPAGNCWRISGATAARCNAC